MTTDAAIKPFHDRPSPCQHCDREQSEEVFLEFGEMEAPHDEGYFGN